MKANLAIHGGEPAVTSPLPPMYPGGMRIGAEEEAAVLDALRGKRLFRYYGPERGASRVEELEAAFAAHVGATHALAVTSGTAALMGALVGLGIGPGDEVIVPAYTWIATASAVFAMGAAPVIADVDESLTLDPESVRRAITPYTRAVIAVHMRGAPCAMDALIALGAEHGLAIIEDTAQACGATYHGRYLGTIGDVGAFSFQFNKIITSGEGGMLTTDDAAIYRRALMYHDVAGGLRNAVPNDEVIPGVNHRMSELHGVVALAQLGRLEGILADMRRRKQTLKDALGEVLQEKGLGYRIIHDPQGDAAIALIFFARSSAQARELAQAISAEGVRATNLYSPDKVDYHVYCHWTPIMGQRAWSANGGPWKQHPREIVYTPDMCPRSLDLLGRTVHLDVSPDLTDEQVVQVADAVTKVVEALA